MPVAVRIVRMGAWRPYPLGLRPCYLELGVAECGDPRAPSPAAVSRILVHIHEVC